MRYCKYCATELSEGSQFCGNCGSSSTGMFERPKLENTPLETDMLTSSDSLLPTKAAWLSPTDAGRSNQDELGIAEKATRGPEEQELDTPPPENFHAIEFGLPLAFLTTDTPPSVGNVPMVQGTPPGSGAPMVQGTSGTLSPSASLRAGHPPTHYHMAGHPPTHHIAKIQPNHIPSHMTQAQPIHVPNTLLSPKPKEPLSHHEQPRHQRHHQGHPHQPSVPKLHIPHVHGAIGKLLAGSVAKWVIVVVASLLILLSAGLSLVLASHPGLSLSSSGNVVAGGTLHLHGSGFIPGNAVTLTLDNKQTLSFVGRGANRQTRYGGRIVSAAAIAAPLNPSTPFDGTIRVGVTGAFDVSIIVSKSWGLGTHTLRATEGVSSGSAELSFTIIASSAPLAAQVSVSPNLLDFGKIEVGTKVVLSIVIKNVGGQPLQWTGEAVGALEPAWLKLETTSGNIDAGGHQLLYVSADTSQLTVGTYSTTLHLSSNGGEVEMKVSLQVTPKGQSAQARLDVNPPRLNFGQLTVGQQASQVVTIGNLGTAALNWSVDTASTNWLKVDSNSGTIQPGDVPVTVTVSADSTNLTPGPYSATLTINSNGGHTDVGVTLIVPALTPTPSPTAPPTSSTVPPISPTVPPPPPTLSPSPTPLPTWSINPIGLDTTNCLGGATWSCVVTLTESTTSQSGINWSAIGTLGESFSPASGTLSPSGQQQVTISSIPCQNDIFTFNDSSGATPLAVPWSCSVTLPPSPSPTPPPTWSVAPTSLDTTNPSCSGGSSWTCVVTLIENATSQSTINWSVTGTLGESFSPAIGTLLPGGQQQVTISNIPCQNDTFTFSNSSGAIPLAVPWSCSVTLPPSPSPTPPPTLMVSPRSINANTDCTWDTTYAWGCSITLSNAANAQSSLDWSASSSNISSYIVGFTPSSGTLAPGASVNVGIIVGTSSHSTCQQGGVNGTLIFTVTGTTNPVTVPWQCTLPMLSASPASMNGDTDCSHTAGGPWMCSIILTQQSPGATYWFASSDNSSVFPDLTGGLLSGVGASATVSFTVPSMICPATLNIFFSGGANPVTVPWRCSAPPPPPTLVVSPTTLNPTSSGCITLAPNVYQCPVTLSETASSQGNVDWTVSSTLNVQFGPAHGTLSPGQSVQVTILFLPCQNGTITFSGSGGATPAVVSWTCP